MRKEEFGDEYSSILKQEAEQEKRNKLNSDKLKLSKRPDRVKVISEQEIIDLRILLNTYEDTVALIQSL